MTIESRLDAAATKAESASEIARQWANGPQNSTVATESGPLPTLAEFMRANAAGLIDTVKESELADANSHILIAGIAALKYRNLKVFGHYVTDRDSESSVAAGWFALLADLNDGDVIVFDGMFKTPTQANQLILEGVKNIALWGGGFYRWTGCAEHIIRFHACEGLVVHAMTFQGNNTAWFQWGFQGLYFRDCVNSIVHSCKFYNIGDAAIRTCRVTETYFPPTTIGLIIVNNFFTNCTQVTTSGTGALKFIFASNICENMYSLKIARRNTEPTGWHLIYDNQFNNCEMGVELQGASKVRYTKNTVTGASLARMYRNDETFGATWVANKDIIIHDNDFIATSNDDCIYINNENSDISTPTDVAGFIQITKNRMTQNFSGGRGAIFVASYAGAKVTDKLTISDNEFLGSQHLNAIASPFANPISMDGMDLEVCNNKGSFTGWFVQMSTYLNPTTPNGSFICEDNKVSSAGIIDISVFSVIESSAVLRELVINKNTFKTTGNLQHLKLGISDKLPLAQHIEIVGNKFKVDANTGGDIVRFCAPPASRSSEFSYLITNNDFLLTGIFNTGPNQPRSMIAPVQTTYGSVYPENSIIRDNVWVGTNARIPRSDNAAIPFSMRTFVRRSRQYLESQRELIWAASADNISGVAGTTRNTKVYSDGSVEIFGVWQNAVGNSFNLTLGANMADTDYVLTFAPVFTEALAVRVVSKGLSSCVLRFSTLAAADVSPAFTYSIIGRLSESDLANYV